MTTDHETAPADHGDDDNQPLDWAEIDHDIAAGAKAFGELLRNAGRDWTHWSATILGLRGLRTRAFAKAGTTNMQSQVYRDAMSALLVLRKHAIYDQMKKQDRSDCYRLMDRLEDVDVWYSGLANDDKLRWKHPGAVAKHCPKEYLSGMRQHNQPKPVRKALKKPPVNPEIERLRALVDQLIKRLAKYEPSALDLLDQLYQADPDDRTDNLFNGDEADSED